MSIAATSATEDLSLSDSKSVDEIYKECWEKWPEAMMFSPDEDGIIPANRAHAARGQLIDLVRCIAHKIAAEGQISSTKSRSKSSVKSRQITKFHYPVEPVVPDFAVDISKAKALQLTEEDIDRMRQVLVRDWPVHAEVVPDRKITDRWALLAEACDKDMTNQLPISWPFAQRWGMKYQRLFCAATGLSYTGYLKIRTGTDSYVRLVALLVEASEKYTRLAEQEARASSRRRQKTVTSI